MYAPNMHRLGSGPRTNVLPDRMSFPAGPLVDGRSILHTYSPAARVNQERVGLYPRAVERGLLCPHRSSRMDERAWTSTARRFNERRVPRGQRHHTGFVDGFSVRSESVCNVPRRPCIKKTASAEVVPRTRSMARQLVHDAGSVCIDVLEKNLDWNTRFCTARGERTSGTVPIGYRGSRRHPAVASWRRADTRARCGGRRSYPTRPAANVLTFRSTSAAVRHPRRSNDPVAAAPLCSQGRSKPNEIAILLVKTYMARTSGMEVLQRGRGPAAQSTTSPGM